MERRTSGSQLPKLSAVCVRPVTGPVGEHGSGNLAPELSFAGNRFWKPHFSCSCNALLFALCVALGGEVGQSGDLGHLVHQLESLWLGPTGFAFVGVLIVAVMLTAVVIAHAVRRRPTRHDQIENPIHQALDLADVPWRATRAALAERFGVRRHQAYDWDVIEINTKTPLVRGLLYPLSVQAFPDRSTKLPATYFSSETYFTKNARKNLNRTAQQLRRLLGAPQPYDSGNTVGFRWTFGAASVTLICWPPDKQSPPMGSNPAHGRDPRLAAACHVNIETGFKPSPTTEEINWLNTFAPVAALVFGAHLTEGSIKERNAHETELEFVREPVVDLGRLFRSVGYSADRQALIFCHSQLYLVPKDRIVGFRVDRLLPARGPGGAELSVQCATDYEGVKYKWLQIDRAPGVDSLSKLGETLAGVINRKCETTEGYDE